MNPVVSASPHNISNSCNTRGILKASSSEGSPSYTSKIKVEARGITKHSSLGKQSAQSPSNEKSYLKSRRQQHRSDRRSEILNSVDNNLEVRLRIPSKASCDQQPGHLARHLASTQRSPLQGRHKFHNSLTSMSTMTSNGTVSTSSTSTGTRTLHNSASSNQSLTYDSPCNSPTKPPRASGGRLRRGLVQAFQKNRASDLSPKVPRSPRTFFRRPSLKHSEPAPTPEEIEHKKLMDIVDTVIEMYPKACCKSFKDHRDFAFAELTTLRKPQLTLEPKTFEKLRGLLETKLRQTLEQNNSIDRSDPSLPSEESITPVRGSSRSSRTNLKDSISSLPLLDGSDHGGVALFVAKSSTHEIDAMYPDSCDDSSSANQSRKKKLIKQVDDEETSHTDSTILTMSPLSISAGGQRTFGRPSSDKGVSTRGVEGLPPTPLSLLANAESINVTDLALLGPLGQSGLYTGAICPTSGHPHGQGYFRPHPNEKGHSYKGNWDQGHWNGEGTLTKSNGDRYEGSFENDLKHGTGIYRYKDGVRYFEGRYIHGQRLEGTMHYGDNSVYTGQWLKGKRHGRGSYKFSDGSRYKGDFDLDRIDGVGQLVWPDGSTYVGEWSQGLRHGMGQDFASDGSLRFEGKWEHGKPMVSQ